MKEKLRRREETPSRNVVSRQKKGTANPFWLHASSAPPDMVGHSYQWDGNKSRIVNANEEQSGC